MSVYRIYSTGPTSDHHLTRKRSDTTPENKVHKLSLQECYDQGFKDGQFAFHDHALWASLSKPKRTAYDRGNISGRKSPIRC